ncbi:hypothetical protein D3C85_1222320 [compost metagenome]
MQQVDPLQPRIHLQAVEAVRRDGRIVDIGIQGKAVTKIIEQSPFKRTQQRLQRTAFGQGEQCGSVVIEYTGQRVFGGQQANQQFIEIEAAEQRLTIEPGGNTRSFHPPDILQLATPTKLHFQRHERPRQRPRLAPRTAQHRPQPPLWREEVHQRAVFAVGAGVQDVGGLGDGLGHKNRSAQ